MQKLLPGIILVMLGNHWAIYSSKSNPWRSEPSRKAVGTVLYSSDRPGHDIMKPTMGRNNSALSLSDLWLTVLAVTLTVNVTVTLKLPKSDQSGTEGGRSESKEAEFCRHRSHIRNFAIRLRIKLTTSQSQGGRCTTTTPTGWICHIRTE